MQRQTVDIHELVLKHNVKQTIAELERDEKLINKINGEGFSLLQLAAREGLNELVTFLCFHGANVQYCAEAKNSQAGKTPLQLAKVYGHEVVERILEVFDSTIFGCNELHFKSLYVWAITQYEDPAKLTLPRNPSLFISFGLLELAAYLNKPLWAEKIMSLHGRFPLRDDILIRTPAYWAACHNNDNLFQKVCATKSNLPLTLWQLQEDGQTAALKPFFSSLEQLKVEDLPEDKDDIPGKFRNSYLAALKAKGTMVRQFSYEARRVIIAHSLKYNNFVPLVVMQQQFKQRKEEFLMGSLNYPDVFLFELLSQNISFYDFVLKLSPEYQRDYLIGNCNKMGLLNSLLSLYLIREQIDAKFDTALSNEELAIYNILRKNDNLMLPLADAQITNHKKMNQRIALFKFFGLPFSNIAKKEFPIDELGDDDLIADIFSFLKKDKKNIGPTNKRFYTIIIEAKSDKVKSLQKEVKTVGDHVLKLEQEIERLQKFEEELEGHRKRNPVCLNRLAMGWSLTGLLAFPAAFISNIFCILKLRGNKNIIVADMSAVKYATTLQSQWDPFYHWHTQNITLTCNSFNQAAWYGCNPWKYGCHYEDTITCHSYYPDECIKLKDCYVNIPGICSALCDTSYWIDVDDVLSITTAVLLCLLLFFTIPGFYFSYSRARENKFHKPEEKLNSYPRSLEDKTKAMLPLISQRSGDLSEISNILASIKFSINQKKNEKTRLDSEYKNTTAKRRVFRGFFKPVQPEAQGDWSIEFKDEPPKVAHVGSLNDHLGTPLLDKQDDDLEPGGTPRKSSCPACVIL